MKPKINPNIFGILGLFPFVHMATRHKSRIAQIVACNGLLFHTFFRTSRTMKHYDIICNIILTMYVNAKARDPWILIFTIIATIGFMNNIHKPKGKIQETAKDIAHVLTVQLPLFIGLHLFT
tara:strand:- start:5425 stop:5790 length:366 start_codon:yes stop_codon:yes gene_type:complete